MEGAPGSALGETRPLDVQLAELMRDNPWTRAPLTAPPYVLPGDGDLPSGFATELLPVPWSGPAFSARVLLLLLNPSYVMGKDEADLGDRDRRLLYRAQLTGCAPFPWLLPRVQLSAARQYWPPKLRQLREDVTDPALLSEFATVQYLAYASRHEVLLPLPLPSQAFTARVVRQALMRGALILVGKGWHAWQNLVPELGLARDGQVHRLPYPHLLPYMTPGMLGEPVYRGLVGALSPR